MADYPPPPPATAIPQTRLSHGGGLIPIMGLGLAADRSVAPEEVKAAVLEAIKLGYRHFDTAFIYRTEQPLGDAVREAVAGGLITSRQEVFVTSKLWLSDAHPHLVIPALRRSLRNLKMEYVDLYLIHWPLSCQPGKYDIPCIQHQDFLPMDYKGVWDAMEDCQMLGLARAIGVSNFTCQKLATLLASSSIPPAVNQVEVNPMWQQKKLIDFCKKNGIVVTAYSPLGAIGGSYGRNNLMGCKPLKEIAQIRGKNIPQVCLRWAFEQGISFVVKSFNRERMKQNLHIFSWELTVEDIKKIQEIPQRRGVIGSSFTSTNGPYKTVEQLWDGDL